MGDRSAQSGGLVACQPGASAPGRRNRATLPHFSVPFPRVRTQIAFSPRLTGVFRASRLKERDTRRSEARLRPRSIERLPRCNGRPREVVPSLVAVALFGFPADRGRAAAPSRGCASALPAERISARSIHLLRADSFSIIGLDAVRMRLAPADPAGDGSRFRSPATARHAIFPHCGVRGPLQPELYVEDPRMSGCPPAKARGRGSLIR